jgi:type I restriction enzyme R subunit
MSKILAESEVEEAVLEILKELSYSMAFGPEIAVDGTAPERTSYSEVILTERTRNAIDRLNPKIPTEAREEALRKLLRTESHLLIQNNKAFHKMLADGVNVEYKRKDGSIAGDNVRLFDFQNPENNEFHAVNQFTVIENNNNRRPDVVLFINGIPLIVIELKSPADENATIDTARNQLETYKVQIPSLMVYNCFLVISDGMEARAGTISSAREWFMPWKTIDGTPAPRTMSQLEVLLKGMCGKNALLDLIRHFIVFEQDRDKISKKLAAYHQYHAVNKAVEKTIKASKPSGDKRCGVVWHTQGSGKSLSMVFYAGKLVLEPALENPTIIVLTDRNDLDDQLFGTFSRCHDLLRQKPVQAETRPQLQELLRVSSGGIVFTTAQKFLPERKGDRYPLLSDRRNIIVIADEAHRSQYDFIDGFARNIRDAVPNASFIGFTGTPIEKADRSTPAVFGDYIDVYDIEQAVIDKATVKLYYESRLAKLELEPSERPKIDPEFDEVTETEEVERKEHLKSKWARMEAVVGSKHRIEQIAKDIVNHFETRLNYFQGKGMIVCMSRRICIDLYNEMSKLRPQWHSEDDKKGFLKVIMTGSASDPVEWQQHIRNKPRRHELGDRMKDTEDPLKLAIVRDMWLTGFDVPSLHTMYIDKPMRGHTLMQAIARADRVFKDKEGGLIVDYLGIADDLKKALAEYTEGDKKYTAIPQEQAVAIMLEKYEIVCNLFHGFNYKPIFTASAKDKLSILGAATDYILQQKDGKERCLKHVTELSKAFALAVPSPEALEIRDDLAFFQTVRSALAKAEITAGKPQEELDTAVKQIVSKAITAGEVIDLFAFAGLEKPEISILSPEFLAEVKDLPQKNLALELLKKLLNDEIRTRQRKNLIQGRAFSEMLEETVVRYQNKSIETTQVIEELIELARKIRESNQRGEQLSLTEDELAFYDALEVNDSAVKILGDQTLRTIARELTDTVRKNVTIDWTLRENVQAKLRVMVKRILRQHGYPPDKQKKATDTVLEQANIIAKDWAEPTTT